MRWKDKLYGFFVDRKPEIKREYELYVNRNIGLHHKNRLRSWIYLCSLQLVYLGRGSGRVRPQGGNNLDYPEIGIEPRVSVEELVEKLAAYDVVSFDIFDTLVLRGISDPKNLFILIGNRLKVTGFKSLRIQAESDARERHPEKNGEITIDDIYERLEKRCGIKKEDGIRAELQAELEFCFANPYMLEVARKLKEKGKRMIAVSNMYWKKDDIGRILESCGYSFISEIYVSCEYECSKYKGALQKKVWDVIGCENRVIHVGDNYTVDFVGSRMAGWKAFYYRNVNEVGQPYRPVGMSELGGSIYSGLVNAKFHHGLLERNPYFELGYAYGGPLVVGFCRWINEYVENHHIDKLLFTSRDMYCVHQVYNKFFAQCDNDYIAISRFAAQRFSFKGFSEYFINSHIRARSNIEKLTIRDALEELEIDSMYPYLGEYDLDESQMLDSDVFPILRQCMEEHKDDLLQEFRLEKEAAIGYYEQFVAKHKRIAVVDLGWQGTNALCLKYLLEQEAGLDVEVRSLLICALGQNFVEHTMTSGTQQAFCCSPHHNRDMIGRFVHPCIGRFVAEMIFTSEEDSLKRFERTEKGIQTIYMPPERRNAQNIRNVNAGILEYAGDFNRLGLGGHELFLHGREVLLPLNKLSYNEDYCKKILNEVEINPWIGVLKNPEGSKIEKIVR